ncbi:hypothetical protein VSX64_09520 [Aurantimonas sp. C2-6-R+9]|uniref:hypothetical protein n=1 Tax=unclassified Aurantimonas TaxID=2638230 RepID=UPI002E188CC5|nr:MULTISPECIES: hypothetical protein [unclassified Aurantimonas]MEC5292524.1 hypothetical protein [Aurantimonas sp. C2-3-R2]MEC5381115.1 hypothetical protein [Aurantimonas sp. C2-6-R+9]MEC5413556.1 hypothetical protein [Aurantimonas sp. C2-4-R8]
MIAIPSAGVSGVSNLAYLTPEERNYFRKCKFDQEIYQDSSGLRLHHFIKAEKPYFLRKLKLSDLKGIVPVKPILNNRRILAQQGAFLLFGLQSEIKIKSYRFMRIDRFRIFGNNKKPIFDELDLLNINESTMFPEIGYAAGYLSRKTTPVTGLPDEIG